MIFAQTGGSTDVAAAISNLETDAVKADLTGDPSFYREVLTDDWNRGYDIVIKGKHRAHAIIVTDTLVKLGGKWKQIASHGSEAK